ncbi:MAG: nicotinamide-nucleotide amidohydrolase family protein, partial [Coriobacteriales bacterium]|nr:nicotinamide-nucleotide amidohydrolase family protein [Coriobacteriales bacterium]
LGKFLDPLADKILVTAALLALIELGSLPAWVALVIIAREFLVSGLRMVASAEGQVIAASPLGKVKTWTQIIAVLLFIIKSGTWAKTLPSEIYLSLYVVAWAIMLVALVMTLWSMIDYFVKARRLLGFAQDEQVEQKLTERVITAALATGQTIATAESLTGGLIGAALTSVPGSSAVYVGGVNSYTEQVKMAELGVKADTLSRYTVVSEPVAREMAQGALDKFKTDLAVSVTGVAGPGGGSEATPVGTVCHGIAWRDARGKAQVKTYTKHYPGDRASVRRQTMEYALQLLLERLDA